MSSTPVQVLVAGAQKAGTTSVLAYLDHHPSLVGHAAPEMPYFIDGEMFQAGWEPTARRYYGRAEPADGQLRLAKSAGVCFLPEAAMRAHRHNPDMKVLVMLREPTQRAFSAYRYFVAREMETAPTFAEALAREEARLAESADRNHLFAYVGRGLYADQLRRLYELFGREQVHVAVFEEFLAAPVAGLHAVCDWLGVARLSDDDVSAMVTTRHNATETVGTPLLGLDRLRPLARRIPLPPVSRVALRRMVTRARPVQHLRLEPAVSQQLRERFEAPNDALFDLLGRRIAAWEPNPAAAAGNDR